jgi:sulfane dehydrogenase subunit SoxC
MNRRGFLQRGAALTGSLLVSGTAVAATAASQPKQDSPLKVPAWTTHQGMPVNEHPYGVPSPHENQVVREITDLTTTHQSSWSFTPLQDMQGPITPNGLFYERSHAGVPNIDPKKHRLLVHGLVRNPRIFTMQDLLRFPAVSKMHFLECSGNTLTEWDGPKEKTVQQTHGLLSCCTWTGVPVSLLFDELGLKPGAKWVLAEGADAAAMDRSTPLWKMMDDALLVYAQNGEMLRPEQGYPLRLLLPGFEGNMNIKWLRRLEIGDSPWMTREETSKYTDLMPNGKARMFTFVMEAKSVIVSPSGGQVMPDKGLTEIRGMAWSGYGAIKRVDVSFDGGKNWQPAKLDQPVLPRSITYFRLPWRWNGEPAILQSRAIDESGYVQPTLKQLTAVRGVHSVYHLNAIQSWRIDKNGEVSNVQV